MIRAAIRVAKIATGEESDDRAADDGKYKAAQALGKKGGRARADRMTPERRAEIARQAAENVENNGLRNNFKNIFLDIGRGYGMVEEGTEEHPCQPELWPKRLMLSGANCSMKSTQSHVGLTLRTGL